MNEPQTGRLIDFATCSKLRLYAALVDALRAGREYHEAASNLAGAAWVQLADPDAIDDEQIDALTRALPTEDLELLQAGCSASPRLVELGARLEVERIRRLPAVPEAFMW